MKTDLQGTERKLRGLEKMLTNITEAANEGLEKRKINVCTSKQ